MMAKRLKLIVAPLIVMNGAMEICAIDDSTTLITETPAPITIVAQEVLQ